MHEDVDAVAVLYPFGLYRRMDHNDYLRCTGSQLLEEGLQLELEHS